MSNLDDLLALEGQRRTDLPIADIVQAIDRKSARAGEDSLSKEEIFVLAAEALEQEVNNGGYSQFFANNSRVYTPLIVTVLRRIGCPITADITQRAIKAAGFEGLAPGALGAAIESNRHDYFRRNQLRFVPSGSNAAIQKLLDASLPAQPLDDPAWEALETELDACDQQYYRSGENLADRLFAFVRANKHAFDL